MRIEYDCADISARLAGAANREKQRSAVATAKTMYAFRRRRDIKFEGLALFEDPAWDILLAIYIDEADGRLVSVSSACYASHVAPTTALRWIARLEQTGALERTDDPHDRRRSYLRLTSVTRSHLDELLGSL